MGEAILGKNLGKKAMFWGALAQSAPDIDFLAAFWLDTPDNLLAHRGFTHSILFCAIITPILTLIAERFDRPYQIPIRRWLLFFGSVIFVHIFLDAFNNYGVGWFEPFSHQRISFNSIYVADPFFSIWTGIAFLALLILRKKSPKRKIWWRFGLGTSAIYLIYCLINKATINNDVKDILQKQQITHTRYFTTPAPFQNLLWFVVAGNDSGYYVGYRSVFDSKKEISFQYFPSNRYLLEPLQEDEDVQKLIRFSQQFYTVERWHDTLVFNDLRFGQIIGWQNPKENFAFHYFLKEGTDNKLVVQRGRFAKLDQHSFKTLIERIKGN